MSDPLSMLCRFLGRQDLNTIPTPVTEQAKRVLIDTLGVIVAASRSADLNPIVLQMSASHGSTASVTCPGQRRTCAPLAAAMINGIAGSSLEFEEGHALAMGHPAIQIVPAALAVAESAGLSGARLLVAVICGYEAACRISQACRLRAGLHPTGSWGVVGSALGVASLWRRPPEALLQIANIAASYSLTPYVRNSFDGYSIARTFAAMANHSGIMANLFFDGGMRCHPQSLEMTFSHFVSERFDPAKLANGLGESYAISDNYFKPYPTCRFTQPVLHALESILADDSVDPRQVEEISVTSFKAAVHAVDSPPANVEALRFSIPYLVGVMLVRRHIDLTILTDDVLDDPLIAAVARKVRLVFNPDYEKQRPRSSPASVRIRLSDGRKLVREVKNCRGDPLNPLSGQEIRHKFVSLTEPVLGKERVGRVLDALGRLEDVADVRPVLELLRLD